MRKLYFLVPGTTGKFGGGGLWAELKTCNLAAKICESEIITYRQRENNFTFLDDISETMQPTSSIFVIGWGFDVPKIISRLKGQNIIYHAHSANYGFDIATDIPIITVSRNTMGYWGERSANGLIFYLPNQISEEFCNQHQLRDIDIVVQTRKSSEYLLNQLIPALQSRYRVEIIDSYIEDLAGLFNRSKIYLYDSAEYWATNGVTEGFGLPPLEAMACGCQIFSSVNHGLSDFLDPGFNCYKIAGFSLDFDLRKIAQVLHLNKPCSNETLISQYRSKSLESRLQKILTEINDFFTWKDLQTEQNLTFTRIKNLDKQRITSLKTRKILTKLQQKLKRK